MEIKGVREYDRVRRYLEHIYVYGFLSRDDFATLGIGGKKDYDAMVSVLKEIYPELSSVSASSKGKKHLNFSRKYEESAQNRMDESYMLRSLDTEIDLPLILHTLAALEQGGRSGLSVERICMSIDKLAWRAIHDRVDEIDSKRDKYSSDSFIHPLYHKVRRLILDMEAYGYVQKVEKVKLIGRLSQGKLYELVPNPLRELSYNELNRLYLFVLMEKNVSYPRVAGSFLLRSIEREILLRGSKLPTRNPYILRNNVQRNVFDEELIYSIYEAMLNRCKIYIEMDDGKGISGVVPVLIRADVKLGRWYLLAYKDKPKIIRLSKIKRVRREKKGAETQEEIKTWDEIRTITLERYSHAAFSGNESGKLYEVESTLRFEGNEGIRRQFEREIRMGSVVEKEGETVYEAELLDPLEVLPLLRKYSPWLIVKDESSGLDERLGNDLERVLRDTELQEIGESNSEPQESEKQNKEPHTKGIEANKANQKADNARKRANTMQPELTLLNIYQSRQMQYALDIMARLRAARENKRTLHLSELKDAAAGYHLDPFSAEEIVKLLLNSGLISIDGYDPLDDQSKLPSLAKAKDIACKTYEKAKEPLLGLSTIERDYLRGVLRRREAALFLDEALMSKLQKIDGNPDMDQLVKRFAPPGEPKPNMQYKDFWVLLRASADGHMINYRYRTRVSGKYETAAAFPWKIEYSAYDRRWWVILYSKEEKRTIKAVMSNLKDISISKEEAPTEKEVSDAIEAHRVKEPVELVVQNKRNALERCFLTFESKNFDGVKRRPDGSCELRFSYYDFDRGDILKELMYLGPDVKLKAPKDMVDELRRMAEQAYALQTGEK